MSSIRLQCCSAEDCKVEFLSNTLSAVNSVILLKMKCASQRWTKKTNKNKKKRSIKLMLVSF